VDRGFVLLLGGARSGKSSLAARLAAAHHGTVTVLATAEAVDGDMSDRIERHRRDRPDDWLTIEEPLHIASAAGLASGCLIVDCITVWLGNVLHHGWHEERITDEVTALSSVLQSRPAPSVVVSNEVGLGIHPETALGREYRDILGRVNARLAAASRESYFVVAGRVLRLDAVQPRLGGTPDG
jgi:adenosyl cobinamide kinase/adenosyl cobinamide phosphate guanylyltransferase